MSPGNHPYIHLYLLVFAHQICLQLKLASLCRHTGALSPSGQRSSEDSIQDLGKDGEWVPPSTVK